MSDAISRRLASSRCSPRLMNNTALSLRGRKEQTDRFARWSKNPCHQGPQLLGNSERAWLDHDVGSIAVLIALSQVIVRLPLVLHWTLSTFSTYEPWPDAHPSVKSDLMSACASCVEVLVRRASVPAISIELRI